MIFKFFREYLLQLVVTVTIVATVTIWGLVGKYWSGPNAVVGAVLLLCGVIYLTDRLGLGLSNKSKVRNWLDSSSYSVRTVQDANEFHFVMTDNILLNTDILQARSGDPITIISANHKATPEQVTAFNLLTPTQQSAFWKNVRLELLRYGIAYSNLTLEGEGVALSDYVVMSGSLTGPEFLKRVLFVRSGARLYRELLLELHDSTQPLISAAPLSQP